MANEQPRRHLLWLPPVKFIGFEVMPSHSGFFLNQSDWWTTFQDLFGILYRFWWVRFCSVETCLTCGLIWDSAGFFEVQIVVWRISIKDPSGFCGMLGIFFGSFAVFLVCSVSFCWNLLNLRLDLGFCRIPRGSSSSLKDLYQRSVGNLWDA